MDTTSNVNKLSRKLYRLGFHRLLGNPFLGSLTAFLTVLFLIRLAVNFYLAIDVWYKSSVVDSVQVASAHLVFLSAYAVWVGALASYRNSLALPRLCFVDFSPRGRHFRLVLIRQIAVLRPMNIVSVSLMVLTMLVFSMIGGNWQEVVLRGLTVLFLTFLGTIAVASLASRSVIGRSEAQILEILYLLFLVRLNPDIGPHNERVSILFGGAWFPFSHVWDIGCAASLIVACALLILLLLRALSAMSNRFRRRTFSSPMTSWYWRFLRVRSWVLLYGVVAPVFFSTTISPGFKRWTLVLSVLFGVVLYLVFIAHCENTIHEKWRCSLSDTGNVRLVGRTFLIHLGLMAIPVLGYLVLR